MPKELEQKLKREARKKHFGKERTNAYVYGTLRKTGWKPSRESVERKANTLIARLLAEGLEIIRHGDVDDDGRRIPALGKCHCGTKIELWGDEECPKCGRMYNSAGQELNSFYGDPEVDGYDDY